MEPISPELALVDPELARRARALLPVPAERELPRREAAPAPVSAPRPRRLWIRTDLLARVAAWLAVPSIALNIAYARADSTAEPPTTTARPRVVTVTVAPINPGTPASTTRRTVRPRHVGVAGASHARPRPTRPAVPDKAGVLRWPASAHAQKYDVVVWLGHRRIADVWSTKPQVTVAELACQGSGPLASGRYLWFVYPLVDLKPRRYGRLAKWGTFVVDRQMRCPKEAQAGR
jgi:hypothetical protein